MLSDKPFLCRFFGLSLAGLGILYFRLKIMNFEGPVFTKIDNPAAFADSLVTRVSFTDLVQHAHR